MTAQQWNRIFEALSRDISDRRGLKWEWDKIDDDVKVEISKKWRQIVEDVECLKPHPQELKLLVEDIKAGVPLASRRSILRLLPTTPRRRRRLRG